MIRIIGSHISPYARKVIVSLEYKGIDYEIDPITPFLGTDDFTAISPLRRIPVLIDDDFVLNDSTVITEYLDDAYPEPSLRPANLRVRAKARWIEEFADSRLGDLMLWRLFYQRIVAPRVRKIPTDEALVARTLDRDLPQALDWLETQAPESGFFAGTLSMADITVAAFFRNAHLAGWAPDPARWSRIVRWLATVAEVPAFAKSVEIEQLLFTVPAADRRVALEGAGVRLTERSIGGREARASPMLDPA